MVCLNKSYKFFGICPYPSATTAGRSSTTSELRSIVMEHGLVVDVDVVASVGSQLKCVEKSYLQRILVVIVHSSINITINYAYDEYTN